MATPTRRRRFRTIGGLMGAIALLAVLLMASRPILRGGWPTCMSTPTAVRWWASRPFTASCTECHADVRVAALPPVLAPAGSPAVCAPALALGPKPNPQSCLGCHTAIPAPAPKESGLDAAVRRFFDQG